MYFFSIRGVVVCYRLTLANYLPAPDLIVLQISKYKLIELT